MKSALRRASTQPDGGERSSSRSELRTITRTFSTAAAVEPVAATGRRPSLATISSSLRLGRSSKRNRPATTTPSAKLNRLGQLFFDLPNELHAHILSFLSAPDVIALRLTCRATLNILNDCAPSILANHIRDIIRPSLLPHVFQLYPPPIPNPSLDHYLSLIRLHHVISHTTSILTSFMQMKIYMLPPTRQHSRITAFTESRSSLLMAHLYPALWTISQYLTAHRRLLLESHPTHIPSPATRRSRFYPCASCASAIRALVASYPADTLLPAYQVMRLLLIHLKQSSRAPSYAGTIERVVRRWNRREAGEDELSAVVLLGGLDVLRKVTVLKGTYNSRLEVVRGFLEQIEEAVEEGKNNEWDKERKEREKREGKSSAGSGKMVVGRKGGIERVNMGGATRNVSVSEGPSIGADLQQRTSSSSTNECLDANHDKGKGKQCAVNDNAASISAMESLAIATTVPQHSLIESHALQHNLITDSVLDQIPLLEEIFLPEVRRRVEKEDLLVDAFPNPEDREEELETPYHWVRRVICGEEDGEGEANTTTSEPGPDQNGEQQAGAATDEAGAVTSVGGPVQQQQPPPAPRQASYGTMFSSMSRHMLVTVGRGD
jgi:hypothetical protein